jgi:hypothetical protein
VTILGQGDFQLDLPIMPKRDVAHAILDEVVRIRQDSPSLLRERLS